MSKGCLLFLGIACSLLARPGMAQSSEIPGVTEVAPGVQRIDGSKVPTTELSASALKAAIEKDNKYSKVKKLFSVNGLASVGPAGTTTYMYKMHDPETGEDLVVILFVKSGKIVDYLIT